MSNSIKQWLCSKRNFNLGVALYNTYGSDDRIKDMLQQGESPFRMKKLIECLTEIAGAISEAPPVAATPGASRITPVPPVYKPVNIGTERLPESKVPDKKDNYTKQWHPLFAEMTHLRARLRDFPTEEDRGAAAMRIMELERQCEAIWARRDYELRTGVPMPETSGPEMVVDPALMRARLNNIRTYITKAARILEEHPDDVKARQRLEKYTAEAKHLEQQLNPQNETGKSIPLS